MDKLRRLDVGALLFGFILLGVGVYYLLSNTFSFNMPELDWDKIWPLLVIALGLGVVWGVWNRSSRGGHGPQGV